MPSWTAGSSNAPLEVGLERGGHRVDRALDLGRSGVRELGEEALGLLREGLGLLRRRIVVGFVEVLVGPEVHGAVLRGLGIGGAGRPGDDDERTGGSDRQGGDELAHGQAPFR